MKKKKVRYKNNQYIEKIHDYEDYYEDKYQKQRKSHEDFSPKIHVERR